MFNFKNLETRSKLSLDALKERAEAVASEDVLATISGGTANDCHDDPTKRPVREFEKDGTWTEKPKPIPLK